MKTMSYPRNSHSSLYRIVPGVLNALLIVKPETVIRWHRAGFRLFWRWKSRCRGGRTKVLVEIRQLIRATSLANPLWGAPRLHGELLKLGINMGQTSVAKYMARRRRPPSQGWNTFLRNHADGIASQDLFREVKMTVARILAAKGRDLITTQPHRTLAEVAEVLVAKNIGAVVVTDVQGRVIGSLSERDIVRAVAKRGIAVFSDAVSMHMTAEVITTNEDEHVQTSSWTK